MRVRSLTCWLCKPHAVEKQKRIKGRIVNTGKAVTYNLKLFSATGVAVPPSTALTFILCALAACQLCYCTLNLKLP